MGAYVGDILKEYQTLENFRQHLSNVYQLNVQVNAPSLSASDVSCSSATSPQFPLESLQILMKQMAIGLLRYMWTPRTSMPLISSYPPWTASSNGWHMIMNMTFFRWPQHMSTHSKIPNPNASKPFVRCYQNIQILKLWTNRSSQDHASQYIKSNLPKQSP